mgnify:CR=1 FL=1
MPDETAGQRIAREFAATGPLVTMTDLARRIDEDRDSRMLRAEQRLLAADRVADEVAALVVNRIIDSRSAAADALLDYRDPPRSPRSDRLGEIESERDALACATHRACPREPGDCCTIGSVIGHWDAEYQREAHRAEEAEAAYDMARERADRHLNTIAQLRAALLATRDHVDERDGVSCWCSWHPGIFVADLDRSAHGAPCLQARAALATTHREQIEARPCPTEPIPHSIRG